MRFISLRGERGDYRGDLERQPICLSFTTGRGVEQESSRLNGCDPFNPWQRLRIFVVAGLPAGSGRGLLKSVLLFEAYVPRLIANAHPAGSGLDQ